MLFISLDKSDMELGSERLITLPPTLMSKMAVSGRPFAFRFLVTVAMRDPSSHASTGDPLADLQ